MKIILATASRYRQEAFGYLGIDFITEGSEVDEYFEGRPDKPEELVKTLARLKAEAVAKNHREGIVIGFDSVGFFNGHVLEKVRSRDEAFQRLSKLSGKSFQFFTGIHMINLSSRKAMDRVVRTDIEVRRLSDPEIKKYLDQDPHYTKYAHGFDPLKNISSSFAIRINGSYNNFIRSIPLEMMMEMLSEMGIRI
jgi:septum formation protein